MPRRRMQDANLYRYAYQGQEKDNETGKEAFELRLWDGRIGRWLTTDFANQYVSPYLGMGNDPISGVDPDGGKKVYYNEDGTYSHTTHNNWFHNFFFGTQNYIPNKYGDDFSKVSDDYFWDTFVENGGGTYNNTGEYLNSYAENLAYEMRMRDFFFQTHSREPLNHEIYTETPKMDALRSLTYVMPNYIAARGLAAESKIVGAGQNTNRGHAELSELIAASWFAANPRVKKVTMDLGYKKLTGNTSLTKYDPRADIGVNYGNKVKVIEVWSKTDIKADGIKNHLKYMRVNKIEGVVRHTDVAKFLNKVFPKK